MLIDQHPLRRLLANLRKKQQVSSEQIIAFENKLLASIARR